MNKAFVREQDSDVRHCPYCGSLGQAVTMATLDHWLIPACRAELGDRAMFCPHPPCEVAYFDQFERSVTTEYLTHPAWPKSADAPICACFGLTCEDVETDIEEDVVTRVRSVVERSKTKEARCATLAANGQSCVAEVQRYYFKLRGGTA